MEQFWTMLFELFQQGHLLFTGFRLKTVATNNSLSMFWLGYATADHLRMRFVPKTELSCWRVVPKGLWLMSLLFYLKSLLSLG